MAKKSTKRRRVTSQQSAEDQRRRDDMRALKRVYREQREIHALALRIDKARVKSMDTLRWLAQRIVEANAQRIVDADTASDV